MSRLRSSAPPPEPAGPYAPVYHVELVRETGPSLDRPYITTPSHAAAVFRKHLGSGDDREVFMVMGMNTKTRVIGVSTVSIGTLDSSLVHPREVLKPLILMNAATTIVCHNHPSGDPSPSAGDRSVSIRLEQAANLLGIDLLDHLILGEGDKYVSMKQSGLF